MERLKERLEEITDEEVDSLVQQASVLFLTHQLSFDLMDSAMFRFMVVLGVDEHSKSLRQPSSYTPILAGLLYCSRLLIFQHAKETEEDKSGKTQLEQLQGLHGKFLSDGKPSIVNEILSLLAYGLGTTRKTDNRPSVIWSQNGDTIYQYGHPITMAQFKGFVQKLAEDMEEGFNQNLLFSSQSNNANPLQKFNLLDIRDDMANRVTGYFFATDSRNSFQKYRSWLLQRVVKEPIARERLVGDHRTELIWKSLGIKQYLEDCKEFMEQLLVLVHITGGQPARGTEILGLQYYNTVQRRRNIFVYDGQVACITEYHKSQSITGSAKVIPRFLPANVGQLLVQYLVLILPFCEYLSNWNTEVFEEVSPLLWTDKKEEWKSEHLSRVLGRETSLRIGIKLNILDYRHLAISIGRKHLRWVGSRLEGEDGESEDDIYDVQAGHSSKIANQVYGIRADIMRDTNEQTLVQFREISLQWHQFLGLLHRSQQEHTKQLIRDEIGKIY
jgi:hypothetical protein